MAMKSWHEYEEGKPYKVEVVVSACNKHIRSDKVKNKKEKWLRLKQISGCGHQIIVYSPQPQRGWGSSPMNPGNWRTKDGLPIN